MSPKNMVTDVERPCVAPSILSADFGKLAQEAADLERLGPGVLHVDVMDGRFVPNITFGPGVVSALRKAVELPLDVHLMIVEPERHVDAFVRAGADLVTVHCEATQHLNRLIQQIHGLGAQAGVALNPATPLYAIEEIISDLDLLLIMTVNPGFGGQKFIDSGRNKIARARTLLDKAHSSALLQVDGGIGPDNAADIVERGADCLVAGSALVGATDRLAAMAAMTAAIRSASALP